MLTVEITDKTKANLSAADLNTVKNELKRVYDLLARDTATIELVFCGDDEIQKLNLKYRKIDKPTDVLSFNYPQGDVLGSIVISADTANKQANLANIAVLDEFKTLAVHGLLHILGWEHK